MATKILVVDDDPDIVEGVRLTLEAAGHKVVAASSGREGIELARKAPPDLILLDVMMETLSEGFHVAYELKRDPVLKSVPIVMVTAVGKESGMDFAKEAGSEYIQADAFLEKPVDPKKLLEIVGKFLKKGK
ncbi:MAG: response regulator [Planctomycetota bacterium]|nr:response regulator [Planctomycetota bacterium]